VSPGTSGPPDRPRQPDELGFVLDAQISYRVADALALVGLPFLHVSKVPGFGDPAVRGRAPVEDADIAKWCGVTGRILVTADGDFKGRWVRSGLLARHGAEVIVFTEELVGLREQHLRITTGYSHWPARLAAHQAGHRVWLQGRRGLLQLM